MDQTAAQTNQLSANQPLMGGPPKDEDEEPVNLSRVMCLRTTIIFLIFLQIFFCIVFLQIICFFRQACFYTDDTLISAPVGIIFFIFSVANILVELIAYEVTYHTWKRFLKWYMFVILGCCIALIALGIIFLIYTLARGSSFYNDVWNDASAYTKEYFDNSQSEYEDTFMINSILACIFIIIEGAIYIFQFFMTFTLVASLSDNFKPPVTHKMPDPEPHGYDEMEVQHFVLVKDAKKKKNKSKAKKKQEAKSGPQDLQPIAAPGEQAPPGVGDNPFQDQPIGPGDQNLPPRPGIDDGRSSFNPNDNLDVDRGHRFSATMQHNSRPFTGGNRGLERIDEEENRPSYDRQNRSSYGRDDRPPFERDNRTPFERDNRPQFEQDRRPPFEQDRDFRKSGPSYLENRPRYDNQPFERANRPPYDRNDQYDRSPDRRGDDDRTPHSRGGRNGTSGDYEDDYSPSKSYYDRPSEDYSRSQGRPSDNYSRSQRPSNPKYDDYDESKYDDRSAYGDRSAFDDRSRYSRGNNDSYSRGGY